MTPEISIIIATFERSRFLEKALAALERATVLPHEIVVWDNGSTDETGRILSDWERRPPASLGPERRRVVRSAVNCGIDAYGEAARIAEGAYIVVMDDDVIYLPAAWDEAMVRAFAVDPALGFLAADVVQDDVTRGGKPGPDCYERTEHDGGIVIDYGPAGGWLAMTPRLVFEEAGGFPRLGRLYYHHDGIYSERVVSMGYRTGVLAGVKVYHACDRAASEMFGYGAEQARKEAQRLLLEADRLAQEWRFAEAAGCYRRFLDREGDSSVARARLAHALMMIDRFEEAETESRAVLRVSDAPGRETAAVVLGMLALRRGEAGQAEELFLQVLAGHPEHPRAHALLGVLLARTGRSAEAADHLVSALFVEPEMGDAARVLLALASDPAIGSRAEVNAALSGYAARVGKDGEFAQAWAKRTTAVNR
ncbi:MAG: glycosyltransferase [Nitrospirae bacterium]|nr:glycosyltransferase [Nitrospirota bacterium]